MLSWVLPAVVCMRAHVLFSLFIFERSGVHIVLWFCFVFLHLVYPMLPASLGCLFLIAQFGTLYSSFKGFLLVKENQWAQIA
jgi:hypothetical protein